MKSVSLPTLITNALPYFAAPNATEQGIVETLITDGFQPEIAKQIVVFVPSAFGRVLLRRFSPQFPDTFRLIISEDGMYKRLALDDEPIFCTALVMAEELISTGSWETKHQLVAQWGAEVKAANQALTQNQNIEGIWFTESFITWDIGPRGPSLHATPVYSEPRSGPTTQHTLANTSLNQLSADRKPWWKFW